MGGTAAALGRALLRSPISCRSVLGSGSTDGDRMSLSRIVRGNYRTDFGRGLYTLISVFNIDLASRRVRDGTLRAVRRVTSAMGYARHSHCM